MNEEDPAINPPAAETVANSSSDAAVAIAEPVTTFERIDRRSIALGRISSLIFAIVISIGILIGLLAMLVSSGLGTLLGVTTGVGAIVIVLLFASAFAWPVWEYNCTSWRLNETGLEIHHGVFWQHRISVPVARVQHADVSQGPLQRRFELGKLTVHTAGTQNASVELNGIAHDVAVDLRNRIVSQRRSSDVV